MQSYHWSFTTCTRQTNKTEASSVRVFSTNILIFLNKFISSRRIMHYFLLGCSIVALNYLSAEGHIHVHQKPRFVSVWTGRTVMINCVALLNDPSLPTHVEWFKGQAYRDALSNSMRIQIKQKTIHANASITIKKVEVEDSGIYFCRLNGTLGPGTELQVSRYSNAMNVEKRSRTKDVIIFLQLFLLILCVVLPPVKLYKLDKKEEAVYEEPEIDHIYEGLDIDQTGRDLYEDINTYAQSTDAAWEVESPDQE